MQRQCKPNAIKLVSNCQGQSILCKDNENSRYFYPATLYFRILLFYYDGNVQINTLDFIIPFLAMAIFKQP